MALRKLTAFAGAAAALPAALDAPARARLP
jgi:hypothetical protein